MSMDAYEIAQVLRGFAKLNGESVLQNQSRIMDLFSSMQISNERLEKLIDISFECGIWESVKNIDPDDWEDVLNAQAEKMAQERSVTISTAKNIIIIWLATYRKLPDYVMKSGKDNDLLYITPQESLDMVMGAAESGDTILLGKGSYRVSDLAVSRGRHLCLKGEGKLGEVIIETESGAYLLSNTALDCENIALDGSWQRENSDLFYLHKDAQLNLKNCVLKGNGDGIVAKDRCKIAVVDSKISCQQSAFFLQYEMPVIVHKDESKEVDSPLLPMPQMAIGEDSNRLVLQLTGSDFYQCGSAIFSRGQGFDIAMDHCNVNYCHGNGLSLCASHCSVSIKNSTFSGNVGYGIQLKGQSDTLSFYSSNNTFKGNKNGDIYLGQA